MKVRIDQTLQVEDDTLSQIADVLDGKTSRRKAKRDEVKDYIWRHGELWQQELDDQHAALFGSSPSAPAGLALSIDVGDLLGESAPVASPTSESAGDAFSDLL